MLLHLMLAVAPVQSAATQVLPAPPPPWLVVRITQPAVDADRTSLARQLVDLIHPEGPMIEGNVRMWDLRARRSLAAEPMFAKIEERYPGVSDAYIAGARPIATDHARQFVRTAKGIKAQVFADRLSATELRQLLAFYQSPTGMKINRTQRRPGEIAKLIRQSRPGTGPILTVEDLEKSRNTEKLRAIDNLSADDLLLVMKFESLPVARKYANAGATADIKLLDLVNHPNPAWNDQESEAGTRAVDRFIGAVKPNHH